jgi:hypothetical protein
MKSGEQEVLRKQRESTNPAANSVPQQGDQKVDGFEQVFQMLKIADPAFRESLLQRLSARDLELARTLRERLARAGI